MSGKRYLNKPLYVWVIGILLVVALLSLPAHCQRVTPLRWAAANVALASLDYETAYRAQHSFVHPCHETNELFGSFHPNRTDFYLLGLGYDAGIESGSWLLYKFVLHKRVNKKFERIWMMPFGFVTYTHVVGAGTNLTCR